MGGRGSQSGIRIAPLSGEKSARDNHEKHVERRKQQREKAYQNRVEQWRKGMMQAGVSTEVQDRLIALYNIDVAKQGKPPALKMSSSEKAFFDIIDNSITLHKEKESWHGHPMTAEHEFGHWLDHNTRFRKNLSRSQQVSNATALKDAVTKDWDVLKGKHRGNLNYFNVYKSNNYFNNLSKKMFGKDNPSTMKEQKIINSYMDIIGSMTNGRYGFGHKKRYYESDIAKKEVFTHAVGAILRKDSVFRLEFPNTWDYINSITKGLYR